MRLGRTLWKIIIIKVIIIFAVFKLFLMPDVMEEHFSDDNQRADHVLEVLTGDDQTGQGQKTVRMNIQAE